MSQKIFGNNNIRGCSPRDCWVASTSKTNTININARESIFNFFMFYNKGITEYAQDEIELNRCK